MRSLALVILFIVVVGGAGYAAYRRSKQTPGRFTDILLESIGLQYWFSNPGALLFIASIPSLALTFVLSYVFTHMDPYAHQTWWQVVLSILVFVIAALPLLCSVFYLFRNEKLKRFVLTLTTVWFGVFLVLLISMVLVYSTSH